MDNTADTIAGSDSVTPVSDTLLRVGAAAIVGYVAWKALRWLNAQHDAITTDQKRDEAIAESFPASDPPASQDFSSPEDRVSH